MHCLMEQHALKIVNKCLDNNIYSYRETSFGKNSDLNLSEAHFINSNVNRTPCIIHQCKKTAVIRCLVNTSIEKINNI